MRDEEGLALAEPTKVVYAVSIFQSRTFWLNAVVIVIDILAVASAATIVPVRYMSYYTFSVAVCNIILRKLTVGPVAFIAPGEVVPVVIKRINPLESVPTITN